MLLLDRFDRSAKSRIPFASAMMFAGQRDGQDAFSYGELASVSSQVTLDMW